MTTVADTGFVEMRLGKVVGIATEEGDASCCVVLDAVLRSRHLPIQIRPSDALNLIALVPAPIFVAQEVLADAEARSMGDSAEASLLRRALECEQMTVLQGPPDR